VFVGTKFLVLVSGLIIKIGGHGVLWTFAKLLFLCVRVRVLACCEEGGKEGYGKKKLAKESA